MNFESALNKDEKAPDEEARRLEMRFLTALISIERHGTKIENVVDTRLISKLEEISNRLEKGLSGI